MINRTVCAAVEEMLLIRREHRRRSTHGHRGFGLGLSIVDAVARAHEGTATAEAQPDGGLLVTVRLPAATVSVPVLTPS